MNNTVLGIDLKNKMSYQSKDRFGKSFWDEDRAITNLQKAAFHEKRKDWWSRIQDSSDIAEINLSITGCGDDGSIDNCEFLNNQGDTIHPRYVRDSICIQEKEGDELPRIPFESKYGGKRFECLNAAKNWISNVVMYNNPISSDGGKYIFVSKSELNQSTNETTYTLVYDTVGDNMCLPWNQEWLHWGNQANDQYQMEFPNIRTWYHMNTPGQNDNHPITSIIESVYSLLPGGWEINEGSNSIVQMKNNKEGDSIQIDVSFEQHVMSSEHHEFSISSTANLQKIVEKYIDSNDIKHNTLNLSTKKHNNAFYNIAEIVEDNMYNYIGD